jgi:hypothetical protein
MVTQEQDEVIQQALVRGLVKNRKDAYEAGCAALRRQLQELVEEESAKEKAAARGVAEAIERNPFDFLRESSPFLSPTE